MTQVIGFRAQGIRYLTKFFNVLNIFKKPFFGFMDFLVGFLELISEFAKILSFSFRLFGNIFAGAVLLFVVGTMIPYFRPIHADDVRILHRLDPGGCLWLVDHGLHGHGHPGTWRA